MDSENYYAREVQCVEMVDKKKEDKRGVTFELESSITLQKSRWKHRFNNQSKEFKEMKSFKIKHQIYLD